MRKYSKPIYLIAISLCFIMVSGAISCKPKDPFVTTPIIGPIVIDTAEQEIVFAQPYKPVKQVVKVCFAYADDLNAFPISKPPLFPDGVRLELTASIIDQHGSNYKLTHVENSVDNYYCISPRSDAWLKISESDTTFLKLIVRSNRRINISRIEWVQYNALDL
jgi:hypothetical protein